MDDTIPKLLLATGNNHKVKEVKQILHSLFNEFPFDLLTASDFPDLNPPDEIGQTFEENAQIKAHAYAEATGLLTLADDSGLVVDELNGRPGIQSARYAATNDRCIERVLQELGGTPPEKRTARFECVVALTDTEGNTTTKCGTVEGRITLDRRGESGFGYDSIFELAESENAGRTLAELDGEHKNSLSHRGRALRALAPILAHRLTDDSVRCSEQRTRV